MIGKLILLLYVIAEGILSIKAHQEGKKIVLGKKHPITTFISMGITGTIWYVIITYW